MLIDQVSLRSLNHAKRLKSMGLEPSHWFAIEARRMLPPPSGMSPAEERLDSVLHVWPRLFLKTPRDVVRTLNALRLYAVPVAEKIDPGDMIFLQLIRLKNPALYRWIEGYVATLASLGDWAILTKGEGKSVGKSLLSTLQGDASDRDSILMHLQEILPGISHYYEGESKDFKVFKDIGRKNVESFSDEKRLAGPYHFRIYFSFSEPSGSISDLEVAKFIEKAKSSNNTAEAEFEELCMRSRPQGSCMGIVMLDRISKTVNLPPDSVSPLLHSLGKGLDKLTRLGDSAGADAKYYLDGRIDAPFGVFRFMPTNGKLSFLKTFFAQCNSLAWLTGIIHSATWDNGHYGNNAKPEAECLFTPEEFEGIRNSYLDRLRATDPVLLRTAPFLAQILYAWHQVGDVEGVLVWVTSQIGADEDFIGVLESVQGKANSSDGARFTLSSKTLETFFGGRADVRMRLTKIAEEQPTLGERATRLIKAIDASPD